MLVVAGPTAVGKSSFGLQAAQRFGGEIVSADSRQVYTGLDIGTAKASLAEQRAIPHHLVDIIDPDEDFGLAPFLDLVGDVVTSIHSKDKLPVVVGGSSQYVFALIEGWSPPRVAPNAELRAALELRAKTDGPAALHAELAAQDPEAAAKIDPRNLRRVIRALEIRQSEERQAAEQEPQAGVEGESDEAKAEEPLTSEAPLRGEQGAKNTLAIGLTMPREQLYERIDQRVDHMIEAGWQAEVESLRERGYGPELTSMSSIGYQELSEHISGNVDLTEAVQRIKNRTHKFARGQYVWLRRAKWIEWFEADEPGLASAMDRVGEWVAIP
jgi:tRNA dimethylallyltransferase